MWQYMTDFDLKGIYLSMILKPLIIFLKVVCKVVVMVVGMDGKVYGSGM